MSFRTPSARTAIYTASLLALSTVSALAFAQPSPALDRASLSVGAFYTEPRIKVEGDTEYGRIDTGTYKGDKTTLPRVKASVLIGDSHGFDFDFSDTDADSASSGRSWGRAMQTQAVSSSLKYVEMLVTNDHARFQGKGESTEQSTAAIVAMIKATYEATTSFSPRITVVLIGQITWIERDPYVIARGECAACLENNGVSVDELLNLWNNWRGNSVNVAPYAHDNGQLYSGYPFEVPTLGYAGVGAMCTPSISGGIQSMLREEFYNHVIAAHEVGLLARSLASLAWRASQRTALAHWKATVLCGCASSSSLTSCHCCCLSLRFFFFFFHFVFFFLVVFCF